MPYSLVLAHGVDMQLSSTQIASQTCLFAKLSLLFFSHSLQTESVNLQLGGSEIMRERLLQLLEVWPRLWAASLEWCWDPSSFSMETKNTLLRERSTLTIIWSSQLSWLLFCVYQWFYSSKRILRDFPLRQLKPQTRVNSHSKLTLSYFGVIGTSSGLPFVSCFSMESTHVWVQSSTT